MHEQAQMPEIHVQTPSESSCKRLELLFYAMIRLSIDFGHILDSTPCTGAAARIHSLHCRISHKAGFQQPAAHTMVFAS